jgi:hypothetical protein
LSNFDLQARVYPPDTGTTASCRVRLVADRRTAHNPAGMKQHRLRLFGSIICAATIVVCFGCVVPVDRNVETNDEMKDQIVAWIPIGTPIADARQIMEEKGYRCSPGAAGEERPAKLHCEFEKKTSLVTSHTWAVDYSYDESDTVTDVAVKQWGTGP